MGMNFKKKAAGAKKTGQKRWEERRAVHCAGFSGTVPQVSRQMEHSAAGEAHSPGAGLQREPWAVPGGGEGSLCVAHPKALKAKAAVCAQVEGQ